MDAGDTAAKLCIVQSAAAKTFEKVNRVRHVLLPLHLYRINASVSWERDGEKLEDHYRGVVKYILHLPPSFSSDLLYLPARDGGLTTLNMQSVGKNFQF